MWYAANQLFEGVMEGQPSSQNLWEECIILVRAESEADAQQQADCLGKAEVCEYTSATGDNLRWIYRGIDQVFSIEAESLESGTELFSRFLRASEVQSLLTPFRDKPEPTVQAKSA